MERLAAFLAGGPATEARFAAWDWGGEAEAARALLTGARPKRLAPLAEILGWVAAEVGVTADLVAASVALSGDKAEVAALLLGQVGGEAPGIAEALGALSGRAALLALARRLPMAGRVVLFRLAGGSFRARLGGGETLGGPGSCLAVLTMVDPTGPAGHFAIRHGNALLPLAKLPLGPHGAEVMAWARGATLERFGPNRSVRAELVFRIGWEGLTVNARRKCGFDLVDGKLIEWSRASTASNVSALSNLQGDSSQP